MSLSPEPVDGSDSASIAVSDSSTLQYEQEPFESFQEKVTKLCSEVGLGTPDKIERMAGGSSNRIIGLRFSAESVSRYVLRIPRFVLDSDEVRTIKDQVSVLRYLSAHLLPVAKVAAYDCTTENAISSQYVIQSQLPGQSVESVYDNLALALEERLQIASAVAELLHMIESIHLPRFGRLIQKTPIPDVFHSTSDYPNNEAEIGLEIGIAGYRLNFQKDMHIIETEHLSTLLSMMCKATSEDDDDVVPPAIIRMIYVEKGLFLYCVYSFENGYPKVACVLNGF